MPIFIKGVAAALIEIINQYYISYKVQNKIGDEGCQHLAKSQWTNLQALILGSKYNVSRIISYDGIRILGKANWPYLVQVVFDMIPFKQYDRK